MAKERTEWFKCSIRVTTAAPNTSTIEGTLFTACTVTNLVAINTSNQVSPNSSSSNQPGDYHIIPASRIQSFQVISPAPSNADGASATPPLQALDTRALKAREANAVAKLQEAESKRGKGVTREAQDIFDAFSRTMPAKWDGTSIVVADAVVIAKPYRVDDCRPFVAGDSAALTRVRKVVR
jgi:protein LSM12